MKQLFKTIAVSVALFALFASGANAQFKSGTARVDNVDFTFNGKQITISYDLSVPTEKGRYFIWCEIFNGAHKKIEAKNFTGDVWENVAPGKGKKITWDFKADGVLPTDEIYAKVVAAPYADPSMGDAMLKSTIMPGWGAASVSGSNKPKALGYLGYLAAIGSGGLAVATNSAANNYAANPSTDLSNKHASLSNATMAVVGTTAAIWVVNYFVTAAKVKKAKNSKPDYAQYQSDNKLIASTSAIKIVDTKSKPELLAGKGNKNVFFDSDVNDNIPVSKDKKATNKFALIFGNEDYSSNQTSTKTEIDVIFARTDAHYFKEYCEKTLAIPSDNILFALDATVGVMKRYIEKIVALANLSDEANVEILFYYAGHGFPDKNKEAYIIPTDVTGDAVSEGIKLSDLYQKLTSSNAKNVTVFLDACFSGGGRNAGLMATRGVKITPTKAAFTKNLVVFSATSADQKANPYNEKNHGLFTYFLLKKLQETEGKTTYSDMADYLKRKVQGQSLRNNSDEQAPETNVSADLQDLWEDLKFK